MFLRFETPYSSNVVVNREDISSISYDRLFTRAGQEFNILPIDEEDLRRFGLVTITPSKEEYRGPYW